MMRQIYVRYASDYHTPQTELYWKRQLENNLTPKEEKELQTLESRNLQTIHKVYKSLKNDKEIQKLIQKIKKHKWVRIIEGGE